MKVATSYVSSQSRYGEGWLENQDCYRLVGFYVSDIRKPMLTNTKTGAVRLQIA